MTSGRVSLENAERVRRPFGQLYFFPLEAGLPDLQIFEDVIKLFASKRDGALVPEKQSFHFRDLKGWHARFCMTEFDPGHSDGQIRILGEDYRMLLGGALRQGMRMSETDHPKLPSLVQYFRELLDRPAVGYFTGSLPEVGREHVMADILDFPAADAHGNNRYILSFIREKVAVSRA